MNQIRFSHNWNGKLKQDLFTTIRKWDAKKEIYYNERIGQPFEVYLKKELVRTATLICAFTCPFSLIQLPFVLVDTGLTRMEAVISLFKKFGVNTNDDVIVLAFGSK